MSSNKAVGGAVLVLVAAVAVVFFPPNNVGPNAVPSAAGTHRFHEPWKSSDLPPARSLYLLGDPLLQMQPWRVHMREVVKAGELPYWNHLNGLGQPFLANPQTRTLYPLNWLFLTGSEMTWQLPFLVFHVFFFGLGVILLLRRFGVGFFGMAVAGASSATFGMQVIWVLSPHATTFTWFPWLLLGAECCLHKLDRKTLLVNVLASALILVAGHPETAYKSVMAVWLYVLGRLVGGRSESRPSLKGALSLAGCQVIGLLLAMPQLLPFLDYVSQSESLLMRREEAAYPALDSWSACGREMVTWLSQMGSIAAHGNDLAPENWWLSKINLREVGLIYGGILAAIFGLAGFLRVHALRLPLALIAVTAAVVTFRVPVLYSALCEIPGLDVGANQRFASLLTFVLCVSSGLAIDGMLSGEGKQRSLWGAIITSVGLLSAAIIYEAVHDGPQTEEQESIFHLAMAASGALLLLAVVAAFLANSKRKTALAGTALLIVLAVDIGMHARPRIPWAGADATWPTTPVVDFLKTHAPAESGRILCVGDSFPADMNIPHGLAFLDSYSAVQLQDEARFLDAANTPVTPSGKKVGSWKLTDRFSPRLLNLASVRFLFIPGDWSAEAARPQTEVITNQQGARFHQLYAGSDGMVLECLDAFPRTWMTKKTESGATLADLLQFKGDLRTTALSASTMKTTGQGGSATLESYTASAMTIRATANGGRQMLVTSEIDSPTWQVFVDGQEAAVERVNGIFRGVLLEEGEHLVEFRARPSAVLLWGLAFCGLGAVLLLFVLIRLRRSTS